VSDANGQAAAYTYFRKDENKTRQARMLMCDEAGRIAARKAGKAPPKHGGLLRLFRLE